MKELKFVDVGEGITEGKVQKWLVSDGESVKEDQPIVQIETDKAVVNIPAPVSGQVKISVHEGDTVKVGDTLALLGSSSELSSSQSAQKSMEKSGETGPKPQNGAVKSALQRGSTKETEILATPAVRKLARELDVDLSKIKGTGPEGRILENDLRTSAREAQQSGQKKAIPKFSELLEEEHGEDVERIPMSQTRKAIARNMELSWTIPRATHMDLINATKLVELVTGEKEKMEKSGIKLTFLPFIIKSCVEALKRYPHFNSSYDHEKYEIIVKKYYNIGIAAEGPDGLKVVVIKDADKKTIKQIAKELQEIGKKVSEQTVSLEEMRDSTFTITNIGSLGGGFLSVPMINYPEVAILGVHLIRDWTTPINGSIKIIKMLPFSLVFDHRVVDGADAVKFGNAFKELIEDPEFLELLE